MAQIDKLYTAIWHDTTTGPGTPLTGLSATITIRDKTDNSIVINNAAMTEVGLGEYDYTFTDMDSTIPYSYVMNPNSALAYVESGYVDPRQAYLDKALTEIAVGWNPYITGIGGIQNGIQKIVDKVEKKGEEVKKKIETEVKTIIIPKQKEPIVNVTTQTIDTKGFIDEIKAIKPNVTTETVDMTPILLAIKNIPQPVIPEQKVVDLSNIENKIGTISKEIEDTKEDILEKLGTEKNIYEAIGGLFKQVVNRKENESEDDSEDEKSDGKSMFPSEFTATLN